MRKLRKNQKKKILHLARIEKEKEHSVCPCPNKNPFGQEKPIYCHTVIYPRYDVSGTGICVMKAWVTEDMEIVKAQVEDYNSVIQIYENLK